MRQIDSLEENIDIIIRELEKSIYSVGAFDNYGRTSIDMEALISIVEANYSTLKMGYDLSVETGMDIFFNRNDVPQFRIVDSKYQYMRQLLNQVNYKYIKYR